MRRRGGMMKRYKFEKYKLMEEHPQGEYVKYSDVLLADDFRSDLENLLMYADTAAKILKDNGFPGKAEALEVRYMRIAKIIHFLPNPPEESDDD